jgi:hypothetical protein
MTPYIYINSPANNKGYANVSNITLNFKVNANMSSCTAYSGAIGHETKNTLTNGSTYDIHLYTAFLDEGVNYWYISCNKQGGGTAVSETFYIWLDALPPTITTSFMNNQVFYRNNISGVFNFSDSYLYKYEVMIDSSMVANDSNMNVSSYGYVLDRYVGNLSVGRHRLNVSVSDGHTAEEIPRWDYSIDKLTKAIVYTFPYNSDDR